MTGQRRLGSGSRDAALVFMAVVFLFGGMALLAGAPRSMALGFIVVGWACGALWNVGRIDGESFRIDPWWLFVLLGAGALWQVQILGPAPAEGLHRALSGAGIGFGIGAVAIGLAAALGRRWSLFPGDAVLFAALGFLVGGLNVLWVLCLGGLASAVRHVCVQRRRGRSWKDGYVALGPGMAVAAGAVFVGLNLELVMGEGRP